MKTPSIMFPCLLSLCLMGCGVPPGVSLNNHFKVQLPGDLKVLHYYCDAYKDPQFLWVLAPIKDDFLKTLVANARLQPAPAGMEISHPTSSGFPNWWDAEKIEQAPELYFRDPSPNDGSIYRVWVDRVNNRLYILFVNT